jgi:hypothetical protein
MSGNTEKIAKAFQESFESYNWEVTLFKLAANADWLGMQEKLYFDDYDVVCLGSSIVAGAPLQIVIKALSLGGGGGLESILQKQIDEKKDNGFTQVDKSAVPTFKWRRNDAPYMGVLNPTDSRPLGIVFTTYGGGFYGSDECLATLETLKLYLNLNSVDVVGKFACCGKETGPAGYAPGVKPKKGFLPGKKANDLPDADVCDAVKYTNAAGEELYGSYFFHYDITSKPSQRDINKAKYLVCDLVEDYFLSHDGERKIVGSQYISLS